jgi:hypothetical protein
LIIFSTLASDKQLSKELFETKKFSKNPTQDLTSKVLSIILENNKEFKNPSLHKEVSQILLTLTSLPPFNPTQRPPIFDFEKSVFTSDLKLTDLSSARNKHKQKTPLLPQDLNSRSYIKSQKYSKAKVMNSSIRKQLILNSEFELPKVSTPSSVVNYQQNKYRKSESRERPSKCHAQDSFTATNLSRLSKISKLSKAKKLKKRSKARK